MSSACKKTPNNKIPTQDHHNKQFGIYKVYSTQKRQFLRQQYVHR